MSSKYYDKLPSADYMLLDEESLTYYGIQFMLDVLEVIDLKCKKY